MRLFHSPSSLSSRLLLTASLVLFIFLGLMGMVLDRAFRESAAESVAERLKIQIYGLLSVTEVDDQKLLMPEALGEPRFNYPGSGLFALVLDEAGSERWRSPSGIDFRYESDINKGFYAELDAGVERFNKFDVKDEAYFYLSYKILWLGAGEFATPFTFVIAESREAFHREINRYRNNLWGWLVGVIFVLITMQALVMKWGLSPLKELAADLKAIEDGEQASLGGDYPSEIAGVTKNLNLLIASEKGRREKYRTSMADLAHSLKTPLAILKGSAHQLEQSNANEQLGAILGAISATIDEQVTRMDEIIAYQLERAVADSAVLINKAIPLKPVADRLIAAMQKVYMDKAIEVEFDYQDCNFFGDERDLMEVLGNVIDNAFKYGRRHVHIAIGQGSAIGRSSGMELSIVVEDDGQGIKKAYRDKILSRGARLDSRSPGQGIGLAVVVEIVSRYDGHITLEESALGGAKVSINFT